MKSVRSIFVLLLVVLGLCLVRGQGGMDQIIVMNTEGTVRSRVGCREVLTCSGIGDGIEWRRFGQREGLENDTNRFVTEISNADGTQWRSDLIFDPVGLDSRAAYTCTISGTEPITITVLLFVEAAQAEIIPRIPDFDVSNFTVGDTLTVGCPVDTCADDVTVSFLMGERVLTDEPVEETENSVYNVNIMVGDDTAGLYSCKVDIPGLPSVMQSFSITGTPMPTIATTAPTDTTEPTTMATTTPTQNTPSETGGSSGTPPLSSPSTSPTESPTMDGTDDDNAALSFTAHLSLVLTLLAISLGVLLI